MGNLPKSACKKALSRPWEPPWFNKCTPWAWTNQIRTLNRKFQNWQRKNMKIRRTAHSSLSDSSVSQGQLSNKSWFLRGRAELARLIYNGQGCANPGCEMSSQASSVKSSSSPSRTSNHLGKGHSLTRIDVGGGAGTMKHAHLHDLWSPNQAITFEWPKQISKPLG